MVNLLKKDDVDTECIIVSKNRPTTVKTRIIGEQQQIARVDREKRDAINPKLTQQILDFINTKIDDIDAIFISDYDKGFLTKKDIEFISEQHPLTFMDTKKKLGDWAKNITYIKLNSQEYAMNRLIIKDHPTLFDNIIVTVGPDGCVYQGEKYPVEKVDVKDLSGAGDTFLAGLVADYLHNGNNIIKAIEFANKCATVVVQKRGVACLWKEF